MIAKDREDHVRTTLDPAMQPDYSTDGAAIPPMMQREGESLGDLFEELTSDFSLLVREEVRLARAETMETVSAAMRNVMAMITGGIIAYAGFIVILIGLAIALGNVIPLWLSSLIVGTVVLIIGAIMLQSGKSALANMQVTPEKTIETLKDDAKWAKEQIT